MATRDQARSFSLMGQPLPMTLLLIMSIPLVVLASVAFGRMFVAVSSTSSFILSYAIAALIGVGLFARKASQAIEEREEADQRIRFQIFALGFVLALIGAVWGLWNSHVWISPIFIFFISIALVLIALQILNLPTKKIRSYVLLQILTVGLLLRMAPYYLNPYVYASDMYFHFSLIQDTTSSGHFAGAGPYVYYPAYHVFNSMGIEASGLPPASFAVIDLSVIIFSPLLFFALGRRLISERLGLLVALFIVIGNFYFPSASYQPTFLGVSTLMTGMFALLLNYLGVGRGAWIAFWIAAITTLLIHPLDFVVLILVLGGAYLALLYLKSPHRASSVPIWSSAVIFVAYIMYISFFLFRDILKDVFVTGGFEPTGLAPNIVRGLPILSTYNAELFYANLGIAAKGVLLIPGLLILLARRNFRHNWTALATFLVVAAPMMGFLSGVAESLQLTRFLLYSDILIVFPLAVGLNSLLSQKSKRGRAIIAGAAVFALAFLSLTSYITVDNGGFMTTSVPTQPRFIDRAGLSAHEFLMRVPAGSTVAMDWGSRQYLAATPNRGPLELPSLKVYLFDPENTSTRFVAIDVITAQSGSFTSQGLLKLPIISWITDAEASSDYNKVFDSGTFLVFQRP